MPKIAYILLCREGSDAIIAHAQYLTQSGDYIAIHFEKRSLASDHRQIRSAVAQMPNAVLCRKRINVPGQLELGASSPKHAAHGLRHVSRYHAFLFDFWQLHAD